jgi:hypothetical protein
MKRERELPDHTPTSVEGGAGYNLGCVHVHTISGEKGNIQGGEGKEKE